jgi:hypothetical protein
MLLGVLGEGILEVVKDGGYTGKAEPRASALVVWLIPIAKA